MFGPFGPREGKARIAVQKLRRRAPPKEKSMAREGKRKQGGQHLTERNISIDVTSFGF